MDRFQLPEPKTLQVLIRSLLVESAAWSAQATAETSGLKDRSGRVRFVSEAPGRSCGIPIARQILDTVLGTGNYRVHLRVAEGMEIDSGIPVLEVSGQLDKIQEAAPAILAVLGKLSAVASATEEWAQALSQVPTLVCDSGNFEAEWQTVGKYAVRVGDGVNFPVHPLRIPLVWSSRLAAISAMPDTVCTWKAKHSDSAQGFAIEVSSAQEVSLALEQAPALICLRDFAAEQMKKAVEKREELSPSTLLAAVGDLDFLQVKELGNTGVDFLAVESLANAPELKFQMEILD